MFDFEDYTSREDRLGIMKKTEGESLLYWVKVGAASVGLALMGWVFLVSYFIVLGQ